MILSRRAALLGLASAWSLGSASLAIADAASIPPGEKRFVVVMLRGAMDGLSAVIPYGDRDLAGWRAPLLPAPIGQPNGMLDLGGFFALHPALTGLHGLYGAGQMLPVHAVSGGYRSRSHFEAQDFMESGGDHRLTSGWLNRVVGALPRDPARPDGTGLSVGLATPLLLRGPAPVGAFAPETGQMPSPDLYARIAALNAHDPLIGPAIARGLAAKGFAGNTLADQPPRGGNGFARLAGAAGHLLAAANGPRIAALEIGGWDTHAGQAHRLDGPLRQLDAGLMALRDALGPAWAMTAVLVMTEFGRTVRVNGTGGTDHGTATAAFLLGGAIKGGRVGGVWPGLSQTSLLENRDLAPTTDVRALAKGILRDHLGLRRDQLDRVFPGSAGISASGGLIHA